MLTLEIASVVGQKMAIKNGPNRGHKISKLQRVSLHGAVSEAPCLEGKTSQGQHLINSVIMNFFSVLKVNEDARDA